MDDLRFEDSEFVVGWCAICDRNVLTFVDHDEVNESMRRCVHCDAHVGRLRIATGASLPDHGYAVLEDGGCGKPDCGNGRCGRGESH